LDSATRACAASNVLLPALPIVKKGKTVNKKGKTIYQFLCSKKLNLLNYQLEEKNG
jgi:hypothetical protein